MPEMKSRSSAEVKAAPTYPTANRCYSAEKGEELNPIKGREREREDGDEIVSI